MTTVADRLPLPAYPTPARPAQRTLHLALLGLGQVGCALASLVHEQAALRQRFAVTGALVRDTNRFRGRSAAGIPLTTDGTTLLTPDADVIVEALGGLEPARSLVLAALERGLPVVTANKSLLAVHGDELLDAAATAGTPLRFEASVIAGVPFLGTFARRPLAAAIGALGGIVNGTSNYILSRMASERAGFDEALAAAQKLGYAEPDPANDVRGTDAAEKLCVLLRHFGGWSIAPAAIETTGIDALTVEDLEHAVELGGVIRPAVFAAWQTGRLTAFAGPTFLDGRDPLAPVDGVRNAIALHSRWSGDLFFSGPGAGPMVTAATLLDDATEAADETRACAAVERRAAAACAAPETGWFVRVAAARLPDQAEVVDLLGAHGISPRRASVRDHRLGDEREWLLTYPCARASIDGGLTALRAAGCAAHAVRVMPTRT